MTNMKFIEITGKKLAQIITELEADGPSLAEAEVRDDSIVRVNQHGDIEVRRFDRWDVVGGLLGNYEERVRRVSGLDWV